MKCGEHTNQHSTDEYTNFKIFIITNNNIYYKVQRYFILI